MPGLNGPPEPLRSAASDGIIDWFGRNARTEVRPLQGAAVHRLCRLPTFGSYLEIDDVGDALTIAAGSGPAALTTG